MNLRPKFLFRKSPKPPEHLDAGEDQRSESSFSFVIAPATPPQSTHDLRLEVLSPVSDHATEGDSAYRDAVTLLSRYRDMLNDNPEFQQLEERVRKLSSEPTSPTKLVRGPKKSLFKSPKTNTEKQERRTDTALLLRDIQAVIGNLTGNSGHMAMHRTTALVAPASVRSSSDPLPLGHIDFERKKLERQKSIRRRGSDDKLLEVHEGNHNFPKEQDGGHRRRGERYDRGTKSSERETDGARYPDKPREKEGRRHDEYRDHKYKHRRKHRHDNHASLDESAGKYRERDRENRRYSHRRHKHGHDPRNLPDEGTYEDGDRHHDREREAEREINYVKEREREKKEKERVRRRDRDRDWDWDRRERTRERERAHRDDKGLLGHDEARVKVDKKDEDKEQRPETELFGEERGTKEHGKDKGKEKEPDTPEQESAAGHDRQQEERKRERREKRERRDGDDLRGHHDYYDKYHDDRYGWTRRSLPRQYHYSDKQGHKRSHSHSGYEHSDDRHRQKEHEKYPERHPRHDDIDHLDQEDPHKRHRRDTVRGIHRTKEEPERMHSQPRDRHQPKQRGSDEESILRIPPPGWRAEQRHALNEQRTRPHKQSSAVIPFSPAPPTVMDYPGSVYRGLTAEGKMKPIVEPDTHRGLAALQNHQQKLRDKVSTKQPQNAEPPIVWNKASLAVPEQSQRTQERSPWLLTSTGSRLRENFTPNGRRTPLPPVLGH